MNKIILILLIASTTTIAQQRILVSPKNEVIPLTRGESVGEVMKRRDRSSPQTSVCSSRFTFGYPDFTLVMKFGAMAATSIS